MSELRIDRLVVEIGDERRRLFDGFTVTIESGEIVVIHGASGSGKSTLLRVIAGLLPAERGTITVDGVDLAPLPTHRRGIGMVFQDDQLFPHLDVGGNVGFGLRMRGDRRGDRDATIDRLLIMVGLAGFAARDVASLSGGEAKRVALARSLAPAPRVLLLDEPLTGLDPELRDRLALDLADVLRSTGTTAIWVTHDRAEAQLVADRTIDLRAP
jgi:thiamine transport system ATP-binding protein